MLFVLIKTNITEGKMSALSHETVKLPCLPASVRSVTALMIILYYIAKYTSIICIHNIFFWWFSAASVAGTSTHSDNGAHRSLGCSSANSKTLTCTQKRLNAPSKMAFITTEMLPPAGHVTTLCVCQQACCAPLMTQHEVISQNPVGVM